MANTLVHVLCKCCKRVIMTIGCKIEDENDETCLLCDEQNNWNAPAAD